MCRPNVIALVLALAALGWALPVAAQAADLIVMADRVWTGDEMPPLPQGVAIRGDRILAVGDSSVVMTHRASQARLEVQVLMTVTGGRVGYERGDR